MKEIETRFLEIDKKKLIVKLKKLGAIDMGEVRLDEIIFYDKEGKWYDEHRFIRLRKSKNSMKLTYKHNLEQTVDSTKEIEFEIPDIDKAKSLLEAIGLSAHRILEKDRHTFKLDNVTFDIDTWPRVPTYVELEGDNVEDLKKAALKVGLDWEKRFDKDARYVFKKYGYDFNKLSFVKFDRFE